MQAVKHTNNFIGTIPGLDCKSEWLLSYGIQDFRDGEGHADLEITLIVKLDPGINELFEDLKEHAPDQWYGFIDGSVFLSGTGDIDDALKESVGAPGRYLIAYIPLAVLVGAVGRLRTSAAFAKSLAGDGLVMTSSLRRNRSESRGCPRGSELGVISNEPEPDSIFVDKETVFIGIIDDGLAVAHERFRNQDGTSRVRYFWDQRERHTDSELNTAESRLPYGWEFEGGRLYSSGKNDDTHGEGVRKIGDNEDAFYREFLSELSTPEKKDTRLLRSITHGTHVLDLATGGHKDHLRPIVAVQLPPSTVADTSGISFLEQYVMSGLQYILKRSARYKIKDSDGTVRCAPVVINFSFGTVAGPRDGTHQLERLFDEVVERQKNKGQRVRLIVPAGNSLQSRCHAEFDVTQTPNPELFWRLQPDDLSPSWLHIWLPPGDSLSTEECPFNLEITTPSGEVLVGLTPFDEDGRKVSDTDAAVELLSPSKEHSIKLCKDGDESKVLGLVTYTVTRSEYSRGHMCIAMRPTAVRQTTSGSELPLAPSGLWRIKLKLNRALSQSQMPAQKSAKRSSKRSSNCAPLNCAPLKVHAWIERDDTAFGYRQYGRQSYFDHPDYEPYDKSGRPVDSDAGNDSFVKRAGLINAIGTGRNTIVVGAAREDNRIKGGFQPSGYSAGGPLPFVFHDTGAGKADPTIVRSEKRRGVDLVAVADDSLLRGGTIAAGVRSGSTARLNGTSVATPQVTRLVADHLAGNGSEKHLDSNYIDTFKKYLEEISVLTPLTVPDDLAGSAVDVEHWESRTGIGVVDGRRSLPNSMRRTPNNEPSAIKLA